MDPMHVIARFATEFAPVLQPSVLHTAAPCGIDLQLYPLIFFPLRCSVTSFDRPGMASLTLPITVLMTSVVELSVSGAPSRVLSYRAPEPASPLPVCLALHTVQ